MLIYWDSSWIWNMCAACTHLFHVDTHLDIIYMYRYMNFWLYWYASCIFLGVFLTLLFDSIYVWTWGVSISSSGCMRRLVTQAGGANSCSFILWLPSVRTDQEVLFCLGFASNFWGLASHILRKYKWRSWPSLVNFLSDSVQVRSLVERCRPWKYLVLWFCGTVEWHVAMRY